MPKSSLFMKFRAKSGRREEVRRVWERLLKTNIEKHPSFEGYYYCFDDNDPDVICVFQITSDSETPQRFVAEPWYRVYHDEVAPLLDGDGEFHVATPVWERPR